MVEDRKVENREPRITSRLLAWITVLAHSLRNRMHKEKNNTRNFHRFAFRTVALESSGDKVNMSSRQKYTSGIRLYPDLKVRSGYWLAASRKRNLKIFLLNGILVRGNHGQDCVASWENSHDLILSKK